MSELFDDLKRLGDMRDQGEINEAEYQKLKAQLMAEMDENNSSPPSTPTAMAPPTESVASPPRSNEFQARTRWWLIGTGVLIAVGSFLPWAQAGIFSVAGTSGDGILTLIAGVIIGIIGIANRRSAVAGIIVILLAVGSMWIVFGIFSNFADDIASVGAGLLLTGLASFLALFAGIDALREPKTS